MPPIALMAVRARAAHAPANVERLDGLAQAKAGETAGMAITNRARGPLLSSGGSLGLPASYFRRSPFGSSALSLKLAHVSGFASPPGPPRIVYAIGTP
jgi:hypothetical protein